MPFEQDFERIWRSSVSSFDGVLTGKQRDSNIVTIEDAANVWGREKQNWNDPMRVQNSFMVMLERKSPEHAQNFRRAIERFMFQEVTLVKLPSPVPYVAITTVIAIIGGVMGWKLPATSFLPRIIGRIPAILLIFLFFGVVTSGITRELWQTKTRHANDGAAQKYTAQLASLHGTLLKICKQADAD